MLKELRANNIIKEVDDHYLIWLAECNKYVITDQYDTESSECMKLVEERVSNEYQKPGLLNDLQTTFIPSILNHKKHYKVSNRILSIEYETKDLLDLIHPKFDHLELAQSSVDTTKLKVFMSGNEVVLASNDSIINKWHTNELNFLTGKLSMEILNFAYQKVEQDWLAVFHASAVGIGNKCVLLVGDSGSGKSTAAALLMAKGFQLLADDFVPLDRDMQIRYFPSAISIKQNKDSEIDSIYPELKESKCYQSNSKNIRVKYLKPATEHYDKSFSVCAIVFIDYNSSKNFELINLSSKECLTELIPDTWISQEYDNVDLFLDWIINVPSFKLNYSDNEKMINAVQTILEDEL